MAYHSILSYYLRYSEGVVDSEICWINYPSMNNDNFVLFNSPGSVNQKSKLRYYAPVNVNPDPLSTPDVLEQGGGGLEEI